MVDFREARPVTVREVDSFDAQLQEIWERIRADAYERFLSRGAIHGHDVEDWLAAESALLIRPQLNISENGDEIIVLARFLGLSLGDLQVFATPHEALVISFSDGPQQVFASFHFPRPIEVRSIDAEIEENVFHLVANAADSSAGSPSAHAQVA